MNGFRVSSLSACALRCGTSLWGAHRFRLGGGQAAGRHGAEDDNHRRSCRKPSELAFKLSKTSLIPPGTILFKVTNAGKIPHDFEICVNPVVKAANFCKKGLATPPLKPGKSATVKVVLSKNGKYEFLCTLPGHASAGMKGLVGIGVKVAVPPVTTTTQKVSTGPTTTSSTTTTATTTTVNDGCAPGMTIQSTGNTDGDDDEAGRPTDEDGCV